MKFNSRLHTIMQQHKQGFILLFTIVIISVTVGLSVTMIIASTRQTQLGSIQSEAQSAFFAADAGYECALARIYYVPASGESPEFRCGTNYSDTEQDAVIEQYNFDFREWDVPSNLGAVSSSCGFVQIRRSQSFYVIEDGISVEKVGDTIESFGYNICSMGSDNVLVPSVFDPNLIERKIVVKIPLDGGSGGGPGDEGGDGGGDDGGDDGPAPGPGGDSEGDPDNGGGGPVGPGGGE